MDKRTFLTSSLSILTVPLWSACGDPRSHSHAVYMLVDTSGTYAKEASKARVIVNYLLGTLQPGDSLAIARVESRSFPRRTSLPRRVSTHAPRRQTPRSVPFGTRWMVTSKRLKEVPTLTLPAG